MRGLAALEVGPERVVPAEVLVDPQHVEVAVGGVRGRLAHARLAVHRHQARVVELAHRVRALRDVALEPVADRAQLGAVAGGLVGERPRHHRHVVEVVAHRQLRRPPRGHAHARLREVRVGDLVDRHVEPVEDPVPVEGLEERGVQRVVRAGDRRPEVAQARHEQVARALRQRPALVLVVLVDARPAQVEPLAVEQEQRAARLELAHPEAQPVGGHALALEQRAHGHVVEVRAAGLPQARLVDREARGEPALAVRRAPSGASS